MTYRGLIVDDEYSGRNSLQILLSKHYMNYFEFIDTARSIEDAEKLLVQKKFDIVFLDIELNGNSGFELLSSFTRDTKVVFVTAYSEYAIQAIRNQAFDYILKPLNPIELKQCLDRFIVAMSATTDQQLFIKIREQGSAIRIPLAEIAYLEANGAYSFIYLMNKKKYLTSKSLKMLEPLLGSNFSRIHKSYIINRQVIHSFRKDSLLTHQKQCLPVSRIGMKELQRHF